MCFFCTLAALFKAKKLKKNATLKNKIDAVFLVVAIILAILIYTTYSGTKSLVDNRHAVFQTSTVNTILQKVLTSAVDIETGTRGYTLTGKENYLEVYTDGNEKVKVWLDSLKSMSEKDKLQLDRIDSVEKLILSQKVVSDKTITLKRTIGSTVNDTIELARGKEVMDSIRKKVADLQQTQMITLAEKLAESNENLKQRNYAFLIFVFVIILFVAISYYLIRKSAEESVRKEIIQGELIDELSVQNVQMNDFASITSHNLRSPAANITSLISIIDEKSTIDDYKTIFDMLKKVSVNLNETLNQLLEILHIKKNKGIEKENLPFATLFSKTIESLQGEVLTTGAIIESDFKEAPEVSYPKIYLESIFHNLISNAIKYKSNDRKPHIIVRTEIKDNAIQLTVKDNGLGIDLAQHGHKIFGMHQVFHKHPNAKGIGLFITKAQIESMDGKISVKSDVNVGTTFTVSFAKK